MNLGRPYRVSDALPIALFEGLRSDVLDFAHQSHTTNTFWATRDCVRGTSLGAALECIAKSIPQLAVYPGVEFWVRIKPTTAHMPLHYDKDEALAAQTGRITHPDFASVLYLTHHGGATLIDTRTKTESEIQGTSVSGSFLSPPCLNSFLIFPGNLAHGVLAAHPETLDAGDQPAMRATLLLNWWRTRPMPPNCLDLTSKGLAFFKLSPKKHTELRKLDIHSLENSG